MSSSTDGAVPAGATVSTQDQTTKFLREDGSWAVPSYTTKTDKANIDGSNITNAATFRSNIGTKQYLVEYKEIPLTYASSSNPVAIGSISVAKTGYTAIGIVGWQVAGTSSSLVYVPSLFIDNNSVSYTVRVTAGGTYEHTLYAAVLYQGN